jgi:hypothetical protein
MTLARLDRGRSSPPFSRTSGRGSQLRWRLAARRGNRGMQSRSTANLGARDLCVPGRRARVGRSHATVGYRHVSGQGACSNPSKRHSSEVPLPAGRMSRQGGAVRRASATSEFYESEFGGRAIDRPRRRKQTGGLGHLRCSFSLWQAPRYRKKERGAPTRRALNPDPPAMSFDDALGDREPEPRA